MFNPQTQIQHFFDEKAVIKYLLDLSVSTLTNTFSKTKKE
jgi:hypothetical protein